MGKTYAFTDIHGQYDLWEQIRDYCQPDDNLYFLGDACDRGPAGIKIIKELLTDPRVIYLKGNHEEMLEVAAAEMLEGDMSGVQLWAQNGGMDTWTELMCEPEGIIKEILAKLSSHIIKSLSFLTLTLLPIAHIKIDSRQFVLP